MFGTTGATPKNSPGACEWEDGRGKPEESKRNTLIVALMESRAEGVEEEWRRKGGQKGCSNGVFVLVGVTHKAFTRAAQLSYRYQTQRISREECGCEREICGNFLQPSIKIWKCCLGYSNGIVVNDIVVNLMETTNTPILLTYKRQYCECVIANYLVSEWTCRSPMMSRRC